MGGQQRPSGAGHLANVHSVNAGVGHLYTSLGQAVGINEQDRRAAVVSGDAWRCHYRYGALYLTTPGGSDQPLRKGS